MFRVYITIIIMLILGSVAYGAKYYYDTTQETISVLRTNNATLETVNKQVTTQFEEYRNEESQRPLDSCSIHSHTGQGYQRS